MKKIILISLVGPLLLIILRSISVLKKFNRLGFGDHYYCDLSTDMKCSFSDYIFKSDETLVFYIEIVLSFIFLLVITSYVFFLIRLYKAGRLRMFWSWIVFTVLILAASPFVIYFIQLIL